MAMQKKENITIKIITNPKYVVEQSDPPHQKFVWAYEISVSNESEEIVQLLHRYWRITDMSGRVEEIHGLGVVGLQPLIKPGKEFTYISFCQLTTPQGTMEGHYEMQNLEEQRFKIEIPKFVLSAPSDVSNMFRSRLH